MSDKCFVLEDHCNDNTIDYVIKASNSYNNAIIESNSEAIEQ